MRPLPRALSAAAALLLLTPFGLALTAGPASAAASVDLVPLSAYESSTGRGVGGAEIVAYDPTTARAFSTLDPAATATVTMVDVVDLANPASPVRVGSIDLSTQGATAVQSVAVGNGVLAVAVTLTSPQDPGALLFYDTRTLVFLRRATVGPLPDAVTFTPDGTRVVLPNEGEAACAGSTLRDPEGSISIVDVATAAVRTASLSSFNASAAALRAAGVRLSAASASVAQDLEPEYVAISADGRTAYVTLQENNALATVDLDTAVVTAIRGVGVQDHTVVPADLSDQDGPSSGPLLKIQTRKASGLVMPDGIAQLTRGADTFLLLAGEGDSRDPLTACGGRPADTARLSSSSVVLDAAAYPDSATVKMSNQNGFGRYTVVLDQGDTDGDGDIDRITGLGSRSLRIVRPDGSLVGDTGATLEQTIAARFPQFHNINGENGLSTLDQRSDDKGPEPESVVVGRVAGVDLAFVAVERAGGVATFDLTDPAAPALAGYDNPAFEGGIGSADQAPEGLAFVSAAQAPQGRPLLLVSNEVSGTVTVYEVRVAGGPAGGPAPVMSSAPSASASASPSVSARPSAAGSASPSPSATRTPSAATSPTAAPSASCGSAPTVELDQSAIPATGAGAFTVRGAPGSRVEVLAYTRPSTAYRVVRTGTIGADGTLRPVALRPPGNTRLYAQQLGCPAGPSVVLNVRTSLSLAVTRTGPRTYAFSGDSLPARAGGLVVSLYRVTDDGRQVLSAQTRADEQTGEWSLLRRFTGAGRFAFVVRTGQDLQNAPGASNVRSLLVF